MDDKVIIELCQSNSLGNRHCEPRVVEWVEVTRAEADELLARKLRPPFFYREQTNQFSDMA